jgi:DNA polymerase III epsilon subunit-like protein
MQNLSLVFDVETTGLPSKRKALPFQFEFYEKARMIEIGYLIVNNDNGKIIKEVSSLIKHDTFLTVTNSFIHGITTEMLLMDGVPFDKFMKTFAEDLENVNTIVSHNLEFDMGILLSELYRKYVQYKDCIGTLYTKKSFCTMLNGQQYLKESKWPKLTYLYEKLHNQEWNQTHRALDDAHKCCACYIYLIKSEY